MPLCCGCWLPAVNNTQPPAQSFAPLPSPTLLNFLPGYFTLPAADIGGKQLSFQEVPVPTSEQAQSENIGAMVSPCMQN